MEPSSKVRVEKITNFDEDSWQHVGYWIEGVLLGPIESGAPLRVLRTVTNGRRALGMFITSSIELITEESKSSWIVRTANSVWRVELLTGTAHGA